MTIKSSRSIQRKLLLSSLAILGAAQLGLLAAMFWIITSLSVRHQDDTVSEIRADLMEKGRTLISNNGQALQQMASENAYMAIINLVSATVQENPDLEYGIYMDTRRQPWVMADAGNPSGQVQGVKILDDSISLWAAGLKKEAHRLLIKDGKEIYEFAAPIAIEEEAFGTIRYGLSTDRMKASIAQASRLSRQAMLRTLGSVLIMGLLAVVLAFLATRRLAARITQPIRGLQFAANAIARGEYHLAVEVAGEDEISLLAADFDSMRRRVKEYTERLHEMVEEKVREIRDILDNIGQGLFTVSYDGSINPDYASTTNAILGIEDVSRCTLKEIFRMDDLGMKNWMEWLEITRSMNGVMPWSKIVRLNPVKELRLEDGKGGIKYLQVIYQPMLDGGGAPSKLMILIQDVTEARRIEAVIRGEKERHEDEVKAILGIVNNAVFLPDFLEDVDEKLKELLLICRHWSEGAPLEKEMPALLRELHTLKGTAATYGFRGLERAARQAELEAIAIRSPSGFTQGDTKTLTVIVEGDMRSAFDQVKSLALRLTGIGGDHAIPVPERKVRSLMTMAEEVRVSSNSAVSQVLDGLLSACESLDHVRLSVLGDRYRSMLSKLGTRLGKTIEFQIRPESMDISPHLAAILDEPLVHIFRNAADHGIEEKEERAATGKGRAGLIKLTLEVLPDALSISVEDDGRGIDTVKVAAKALAMGVVTEERLASMTEKEKAGLIFAAGLSTGERNDDISGMGVGMDAVAAWVKSLGGVLDLSSRQGFGTRIEIRLPEGFEASGRKLLG